MNLIKLKITACLACYDSGYVINRYDHSKRKRCKCSATPATLQKTKATK